jgi:carboxypeptidase family protein
MSWTARRNVAFAIASMVLAGFTASGCSHGTKTSEAPDPDAAVDSSHARIQVKSDVTIPMGTMVGLVRDEDSRAPLGSAVVSIAASNRTRPIRLLTDDKGQFRVADLPLGSISLEVRLPGYFTGQDTVQLKSGVDVIVGLRYDPKAPRLR